MRAGVLVGGQCNGRGWGVGRSQTRAELDLEDGSSKSGPQGDAVGGGLTEAQVPWLPQ